MQRLSGKKVYKRIRPTSGRIRAAFQSCEDFIGLIPTKDDNIVQKGLKMATLVERVAGYFFPEEDEGDVYEDYAIKYKLESKTDRAFRDLVFETPIRQLFKEQSIDIDERHSIFKLTSEFGSLYFRELPRPPEGNDDKCMEADVSYDRHRFWYKPGFNFEGVLVKLWDLFDNKINIQLQNNKVIYSPLTVSTDPFCGAANEWVDSLSEKHIQYKKDAVPRACLFVGPPGVGKSTLVVKIAMKIGQRALRMEASSLLGFNPSNMKFLLGGLKPDCLIVDDVDRVSFDEGLSTIFTVLDWMKVDHSGIPLLMTANRISHLDSAFVRPGRIDEVLWFELPNKEDRLILLQGYLDFYNVEISAEEKTQIVSCTDGLAVPWIKEIALQLRYESTEGVLDLIDSMKKLKGGLSYSYGKEEDEPTDTKSIGRTLSKAARSLKQRKHKRNNYALPY